jgi:putative tryptophan/tyrosine transport system substrate-binding protein
LPIISYLGTTEAVEGANMAAFLRRLRELGWVEGRNIAVEYRWTEGRTEAAIEFLAEFVRLKVAVILVLGNPLALEAKRATSVIPIVAAAGEPVRTGLVASLARPGGNVTGLSSQLADAASKRVGLLREVVPGLRRLAIMANVTSEQDVLQIGDVQATAGALGIEVIVLEVRRTEDIAPAFDTFKGRAEALYITNNPSIMIPNRERITALALGLRLPTISSGRGWPAAGGLMSYGANFADVFRRSAEMVDKILRGTKPADIPVEQPTKFEFIINLKTAKALGLDIPPGILAIADEVIE